MIFIAIIINVLGSLTPKRILKEKNEILRNEFNWGYSFSKLSGLVACLLVSLILISSLTLSTKDRFIENKNAIYGLSFSEAMKGFGFEDGNQIISINEQEVIRVSDIIKMILLSNKEAKIKVRSTNIINEITIKQNEMRPIIQPAESNHVQVIMEPKEHQEHYAKVDITEQNNGLRKAFESFGILWKQVTIMISAKSKAYSQFGGYFVLPKANNVKGLIALLSMSLILIGILNFLPLPGFGIGNLIISIIENIRRKQFTNRLLNISKIISIGLIVIIILINL